MSDLIALARCHNHIAPTHYEGCEADHIGCLVNKLADEVERLRAENERLRQEDTRTRHALNRWVWVCLDGGDEPTHERVSAVVSEVEKQRAEIERLRADRRERIATAVLQGGMANPSRCGSSQEAAEVSIKFADALIAKLDKESLP